LAAGTYSATVTDANGCVATSTAAVSEPAALSLGTTVENVDCNGEAGGSIGLSVSGGVTPYTYIWSNGQTGASAAGLSAGTYSATVTDANGCTAVTAEVVSEPSDISISSSVTPESCDIGSDGMIELTVNGGVSPYGYLWSNGQTGSMAVNLSGGAYTVTVTDSVGCTKTAQATVAPGASGNDLLAQASIKVLLQGPYVSAVQLMHDSLRVKGFIPLTEPYTGLPNFTHVGGGGEQTTVSVLSVSGSNAIVDWVFLELRDSANPTVTLATRAALLQRDGDVVDTDGVSPVIFDAPSNQFYHLVVRHRNHLGAQLGQAVRYAACEVIATDFTTQPPQGFFAFNGLNAAQKTVGVKFVLWAGNGRIDYLLKYNGSVNDRNAVLNKVGLLIPNTVVPGYWPEDYSMDGQVKYNGTANDRLILLGNVGIITPSAILHDQIAR
jgi:hypothetical protein